MTKSNLAAKREKTVDGHSTATVRIQKIIQNFYREGKLMRGLAGWFGQCTDSEANASILSRMSLTSTDSAATIQKIVTDNAAMSCSAD